MSLIEAAIYTASRAHAGQMDEDGFPHIIHSLEVMVNARKQIDEYGIVIEGVTTEEILAAAVLHDVPEDSTKHGMFPVTLDDIRKQFGNTVADIVDALTRREGAEYPDGKEYYRDFIYRAKENPAARFLKGVDLSHNLGRTHKISPKKAKWRKKLEYKYLVAMKVLVLDADEPTWEGASWRIEWTDESNLRVPHIFIADPNGKEIEISKEQAAVTPTTFTQPQHMLWRE